jgi:hypothetical protein
MIVANAAKLATFNLVAQAAAPASPATGQAYFNTTTGQPYVYNGSAWLAMTGWGTAAQSTGWSVSNKTATKILNCNATTVDELADVVGTLIDTLKSANIIGA